jgi:predicted nucleic acid-binding Zn finger protein
MVFADNTSQYLNLKSLARLPNQFTNPEGKIALQHMVAVLGHPNEMVLNLGFCMTPLAIFHADNYTSTASRMLPA